MSRSSASQSQLGLPSKLSGVIDEPAQHRVAPLLETVCLCAIVKNEESNPSGGLQMYLNRILSYVHSAVIVDTGSTDSTLQILQQAQQQYAHLHVFQTNFESFAQARNFSLQRCWDLQLSQGFQYDQYKQSAAAASTTSSSSKSGALVLPPFRHILVLDADEELTLPVLEVLAEILKTDFENEEQAKELKKYHQKATEAAAAALIAAHQSSTPVPASSSAAAYAAVPSRVAAAAAVPASALEKCRYPLAIKFSCHCVDANGRPSPRSNSGLWNPRCFSADSRFSFINLVDDYRFERLMWAGLPLPATSFLRKEEIPQHLRHKLAHVVQTQVASNQQSISDSAQSATYSNSDSAEPSEVEATPPQQSPIVSPLNTKNGSNSTQTHASPYSKAFEDGSSSSPALAAAAAASASGRSTGADQFDLKLVGDPAASVSPNSNRSSTPSSTSNAPPTHTKRISFTNSLDLTSLHSHGPPVLIPMRHYIPSIAGRRKKNKQYKDGGTKSVVENLHHAAAKLTISHSKSDSTGLNSPTSAAAASATTAGTIAASLTPAPPKPKPKSTASRIFHAASSIP